jgi:hypothetical protein
MTKTLAAIGDSQTDFGTGYGNRPSQTWTQMLAKYAKSRKGVTVTSRGFGISGDTSTGGLARADVLSMYDAPYLVSVALCVNDPANSITTATTTSNLSAIIMSAKFGAVGAQAGLGAGVAVADQTVLPATLPAGSKLVVVNDTSTTGGIATPSPLEKPTITGSLSADANGLKQSVWVCVHRQTGERGWRRIATAATTPTHVNRFIVVDPPYRNWTTGGDTPSTEGAQNATLRIALQNVVSVHNQPVGGVPSVIYAGLYQWMLARITAGTDPNFSADTAIVAHTAYTQAQSWHWQDNDQHLNPYGHALKAQAIIAAIDSQASSWWTELST